MGLLKLIWGEIASLGALAILPLKKLRNSPGARPVVRWGLHFLCLAATLGLLWYINCAWELDKALRVPVAALRNAWLPLLFFLTYLTAWCGWWLWQMVMTEDRPSEYHDLDATWREATDRLAQSGVDLRSRPLFLVLGQPAETEASFFSATQLPFTHPQVPRDPAAPLHVHVAQEGVFVTCAGASLLGAQSALLAAHRTWRRQEPLVNHGHARTQAEEQAAVDYAELPPIYEDTEHGDDAGNAFSSSGGGTATAVRPQTKNTTTQLAAGLSLVEDSIALLTEEEAATQASEPKAEAQPVWQTEQEASAVEVPLIKDLAEIQHLRARLEHLCRLIAQTREPYCPLNGVAVLIPYASGSSDRLANQVAALAQRDLETVQEALQVRCPLVAVVCDLHEAPGCRELIQMFPDEQRHRRLGVRFPLLCDDPSASATEMVDQGLQWVCRGLVPPLVYRLMEGGEKRSGRAAARTNARLYQFLDDLRQREARFARILRQAFSAGAERSWLPAGCYFIANGTDLEREQGFAGGVLAQLQQMQNLLAWLPGAVAKDRQRRCWTAAGYTLLVLGLGAVIAAFVWLY